MSESNAIEDQMGAGQRVIDLLGRQLVLYRRIEQLADAQRKAIEVDDTRPLMRLLSQRQKLTTALTKLDAELTPYRERWDGIKEALPPAERRGLDEMVKEAGERLRRILDQDEADGRLLAAKKNHMTHSMSELETARRTLVAYGGTAGAATDKAPILNRTEA